MASSSSAKTAEQAGLLVEAFGFAAEHRFYLRKAVQQGDLQSALRHALCLANELRCSELVPGNYYKLYAVVFLELQHLAAFVSDRQRHGKSLEEIYEIVQYEGNALPRLYMMATVGMLRMKEAGESSADEVLDDMSNVVDAVQHPIRGLLLRYYLLQVVKDKLWCLRGGTEGALKFLLANFKESVSLWQRLRLEGNSTTANQGTGIPQGWELDERRYALRLLVSAHLMQIARLNGLSVDLYEKTVLPEILRLTTFCDDAPGQAYLLQTFIEVFPDDFHIRTLDRVLATSAQVHWAVDLQPLLQHLLGRLTDRFAGGIADVPSVDVFGLFHVHLQELHRRPRTAATPLTSLLSLQLQLCMSALALHPGDADRMELLLKGTVKLLADHGTASNPLDEELTEAVVDIMAAPLSQEALVPKVLAMPFHQSLLAIVCRSMQRPAALAMITAILDGDVGISDCATLRCLLSLASSLLYDETWSGDDVATEDLGRHMDHDPKIFRVEQEAVARLVHQVRHEDPKTVFTMLSALRDHFVPGGPHRVVLTLPALVVALLNLISCIIDRTDTPNMDEESAILLDGFRCSREMCVHIGSLASMECLRLWLLCAASADRAAAAAAETNSSRLVEECSGFVDSALSCLESDVEGQEAQLCGLQLFVSTLRRMTALPESQMTAVCKRAVLFCSRLPAKDLQSKAFCLCSELFWFPQGKSQDHGLGLLCIKRALQCADGAIHTHPLDVDLFIDILNQVAHLFAERVDEVLPPLLSRLVTLCVQHVSYIERRAPPETMRALKTAVADLQSKKTETMESLMVGEDCARYLEVDLQSAQELLPSLVATES